MCKSSLHITEFNLAKSTHDGLQPGCRKCHAKYKAKYEKTAKSILAQKLSTIKWDSVNKEKKEAHKIIAHAIKNGIIVKQPCGICESWSSEAHHEDYAKPLKVVWLCRKHHQARHKEIKIYLEENPQLILI